MTPLTQQLPQSDASAVTPQQPLVDFLRRTLETLTSLEEAERRASQREIIARLRCDTRSHLAALLLSADPEYQVRITDVRQRLAGGHDLGPAMTLADFDAAFPSE